MRVDLCMEIRIGASSRQTVNMRYEGLTYLAIFCYNKTDCNKVG